MGENQEIDASDRVAVLTVKDEGQNLPLIIPFSMRKKLNREGLLLAADLQRAMQKIEEVQKITDEIVEEARDAGMSWATIGWLCGLTAEGARKKWSEPSE